MSDMQSLHDAPVPMTTEGVGETMCFADALGVSGIRFVARDLANWFAQPLALCVIGTVALCLRQT